MVENKNIGGQAVIEGVMFKAEDRVSVAVRNPKGEIKVKNQKFKSLTKKAILGWPLIRGIIILFETLILGMKALNHSANVSVSEDGEEELGFWSLFFTFVFVILLALFLFKFIPLFVADILVDIGNKYLFNIVEGVVKLGILVGYIYVISLMPDVKRVFQYHGAEHKVVNAFEHGKNVTLENAKSFSTIHPRCGSSFIVFVLFLSIIVYIFVPLDYGFWLKFLVRLALLPFIAGIAYELIKLSGKYRKNKVLLALISPGLLLQKMTTREPDDKQIEVALRAFKEVQ